MSNIHRYSAYQATADNYMISSQAALTAGIVDCQTVWITELLLQTVSQKWQMLCVLAQTNAEMYQTLRDIRIAYILCAAFWNDKWWWWQQLCDNDDNVNCDDDDDDIIHVQQVTRQTWRGNKTSTRRHTAVRVVHLSCVNCRQKLSYHTTNQDW